MMEAPSVRYKASGLSLQHSYDMIKEGSQSLSAQLAAYTRRLVYDTRRLVYDREGGRLEYVC
jgi:hypothetical protein